MTKHERGRKRVIPVEQTSILDKTFKPLIDRSRQLRPKIHPLIVLADLRKGSLAILDRYIAQEGGIPDRQVAIEVRKLISGSPSRSRFRLLVVNHPNGPDNQGGRPLGKEVARDERYSRIAAQYRQVLAEVRKAWRAKELVAEEFKCSESTVERAIRVDKEATKRKQSVAVAKDLRQSALAKLRTRAADP